MMLSRLWVFGAVVAAALLACTAALGTEPNQGIAARTTTLLDDSIRSLAQVDSPTDRQRFAGGRWRSADEGCWFCQVGPGTAAAVLWRSNREPRLRTLALSTFDRAIQAHRRTDGGFDGESVEITTMMFGLELATAYLELRPALGTVREKRWRAAIVGAADYLHENGNLAWYTNGNINLGNTTLFYLAWKVSGQKRFLSDYETSFAFMISPPSRWKGFGLKLDRTPKKRDGSDGKGYLAESAGATPGFDAEYTHLQADVAARLYVVSHDPRALRLLNLLVNKLLDGVDSDWALSTAGGTRHAEAGRKIPFTTPALAVLVTSGARPDLAPRLARQLGRIEREFRGALTYSHRNMYRGLGNEVAVILQSARGKSAAAAVYGAPYKPTPPA
jgi:hypothetical protein